MSEQVENVGVVDLQGVEVVNTAHDGYRRAGFVLKAGVNTLPVVDYEKYLLLESDPRLVVTPIASDEGNSSSVVLGAGVLPGGLTGTVTIDGQTFEAHNIEVTIPAPSVSVTAVTAPDVIEGSIVIEPDVVKTPFPEGVALTDNQTPPPPEDRLLAAVQACRIEPKEKWFNKNGTPKLAQWREFVHAELSAADINAALAAHGVA